MPVDPKEILEDLLHQLGFPAKVVKHELEDGGGSVLEIETDDPGRLIGRQGQTLSELQYITNRILFRRDPSLPKVTVDVGGYRSQARETLVKKAKEAADKVRRWGDIVELEPLNAFDRRIVINALRVDPAIESHSVVVDGSD